MAYFGRASPPWQARAPLLGALGALGALGFTGATGCIVTIADPAPVQTTGGGAGATGAAGGRPGGGAGGDGQRGGSAGSTAEAGALGGACDGGTKSCGRACVGLNDPLFGCGAATCTPCAPAHIGARCESGACVVGSCDADWVDCDGKPENGCETDFSNPLPKATTVEASRFTPALAADPSEWSALPRAALEERCTACRPDQPGEQPGEYILNAPHDAKNVRAQFRVAWDDLALYVFAQVEDDEIVAQDPANPEQQDGVELLLDGLAQGTNGYGPDDHHLFIGALGKNVFAKNPSDVDSSGKVTVTSRVEQACYFVQVRLTWFYVMGLMPHTPQTGNKYGFTMAVNDWDTSLTSDGGRRPQRQNQLFWVQPGLDYSYNTSQFANLTLR